MIAFASERTHSGREHEECGRSGGITNLSSRPLAQLSQARAHLCSRSGRPSPITATSRGRAWRRKSDSNPHPPCEGRRFSRLPLRLLLAPHLTDGTCSAVPAAKPWAWGEMEVRTGLKNRPGGAGGPAPPGKVPYPEPVLGRESAPKHKSDGIRLPIIPTHLH